MFESILTNTASVNAINVSTSIISILAAVIIGLVTGVVYMFVNRREGYGKNFILSLVLLPPLVGAVIMLVGSDVARAFSMAGAFTLVRFRSAPGNAKDISAVFFSMASGLACGLGYITFAFVFAVIILLLFSFISISGFGENKNNAKQLRITIPEDLNYNSVFDEILEKYVVKSRLKKVKTTNMGTMFELTYDVCMKKESDEKQFIDELRTRNGNLTITLGTVEENLDRLN